MTDRAAGAARARALIRQLGLAPHPEGGHYRETFRSAIVVDPGDGRGRRAALTSIDYLLRAGERSRWHRVRSDEVWHLYAGRIDLLLLAPDLSRTETVRLAPVPVRRRIGPAGRGRGAPAPVPARVVPAGWWQAARPSGPFALVGCTVGPGFDFADFDLLADNRGLAAGLARRWPGLADLI